LPHSVNIMEGERFETWLGSVIRPGEDFYLAGSDENQLKKLIGRCASIGYESQIREAFILGNSGQRSQTVDLPAFRNQPDLFTILDVRNPAEVRDRTFFDSSLKIPLPELRNRIREIPTGKPVAVHCSAGYRSAIASSLLASEFRDRTPVYDIGEAIKDFG
ncbi:MAG TPA: MBL fold metallo-hydrolase, partial [Sphingobacteriaceae bacterium]